MEGHFECGHSNLSYQSICHLSGVILHWSYSSQKLVHLLLEWKRGRGHFECGHFNLSYSLEWSHSSLVIFISEVGPSLIRMEEGKRAF